MSLLTKIYNLKSKYKTNTGLIQSEQETRRGLLRDQGAAQEKSAKAQKTYAGDLTSFVSTYGSADQAESFDMSSFETSEDLSTYLTGIGDSFYEANFEKFSQTEGYQDWAIYMSYLDRLEKGSVSGYNVGLQMQQYRNRAKQGTADFDAMVFQPDKEMREAMEGFGESGEAYAAAYEDYSSYAGKIEESNERLRGYGATQQEIQGMLTDAEQMYGMSTEQRKRGTRGSARRRSALTSRSGYA